MQISGTTPAAALAAPRPLANLFAAPAQADHREQRAMSQKVLDDIDKLRAPIASAQVLDSIKGTDDVQRATEPREGDNALSAGLRHQYRHLFDGTRKLHQDASKLAQDYPGSGSHDLGDGRTANIEQGPPTKVTITGPDGTQTVEFNSDDPDRTKVTTRDADGHESTVERQGTELTQVDGGETTRFFLEKGQPRKEVVDDLGFRTLVQAYDDGAAAVESHSPHGFANRIMWPANS